MPKINIKKYIYETNIKSTLFLIKTSRSGIISDSSKKVIRNIRCGVSNVNFVLFNDKLPQIKKQFDLVIADCPSKQAAEIKHKFNFNHMLIIENGQAYEPYDKINNKKIKPQQLQINHDLNRVVELQQLRKAQSTAKLAGKKVGHYIGVGLVATICLFPSLLLTTQLAQYKPDKHINVVIDNNKDYPLQTGKTYSALSYNTGFAAYNQDMHFYMDAPGQKFIGGQAWAQSKKAVLNSMSGINRVLSPEHDTTDIVDAGEGVKAQDLKGSRLFVTAYDREGQRTTDRYVDPSDIDSFNDSLNDTKDGLFDFVSLQEQDRTCPKTYNTDQYEITKDSKITTGLGEQQVKDVYASSFAYNFAVPFIPIPLNQMFGMAHTGLATYSRYFADEAKRFSMANITTFPLNMFELKRCLLASYFPIEGTYDPEKGREKYFVYVTAHLSAYDSDGTIRQKQLGQLNESLKEIRRNGDYFLLAADWNQILPDTRGYEGYDAQWSEEEQEQFSDDKPLAGWDFLEFKESGNHKNPNLDKDYIKVSEYDATKSYKAGDTVKFTSDQDKTQPNCNDYLNRYMASAKTHNYEALVDVKPNEKPLNDDGSLNNKWRYSIINSNIYKDASINMKVRKELLPITYPKSDQYCANFYTAHAIPTLRNAGAAFMSEAIAKEGYCYKASIDGFLVSNNIEVVQTFGIDTNFKYSDHNPVGITFKLK